MGLGTAGAHLISSIRIAFSGDAEGRLSLHMGSWEDHSGGVMEGVDVCDRYRRAKSMSTRWIGMIEGRRNEARRLGRDNWWCILVNSFAYVLGAEEMKRRMSR